MCAGATKFGVPNALANRSVKSLYGRPVPWAIATYSGPLSRLIREKISATSLSASSQEIRCHLPSPRLPVRRRGCVTRSGWYNSSGEAAPFGQMEPRDVGLSGSPVTFTTRPPRRWTNTWQTPWHIRQADRTIWVFSGLATVAISDLLQGCCVYTFADG